jgi:hypothetical protein
MILKINNWLKKPDSHQLYSEGLRLFREYGSKYPKILARLEAGYFGSNKADMVHYLQKIADDKETQPVKTTSKEVEVVVVVHEVEIEKAKETKRIWTAEKDAGFFDLQKKLRNARQTRAKMSDSFHQCFSDLDRLRVCEQIAAQTTIIKEYEQRDIEYKRTGEIQNIEDLKKANEFVLPDTIKELMKEQKRYKDRIYRAKISLKILTAQLEKNEDYRIKMKIEKKDNYRKECEIRKQLIQTKLNDKRENSAK